MKWLNAFDSNRGKHSIQFLDVMFQIKNSFRGISFLQYPWYYYVFQGRKLQRGNTFTFYIMKKYPFMHELTFQASFFGESLLVFVSSAHITSSSSVSISMISRRCGSYHPSKTLLALSWWFSKYRYKIYR